MIIIHRTETVIQLAWSRDTDDNTLHIKHNSCDSDAIYKTRTNIYAQRAHARTRNRCPPDVGYKALHGALAKYIRPSS